MKATLTNFPRARPVFVSGLLAVLAFICGCRHTALYRPLAAFDGAGYESWRESADVFMVRFVGDINVSREEVRDLALLRAAQLVSAEGRDMFWVASESPRKRTELIQPNTAPPESPIAADSGMRPVESPAYEQIERERRARNLITSSPSFRVSVEEITLRIVAKAGGELRGAPSARPYTCAQLLRDIPDKYGLTLPPVR